MSSITFRENFSHISRTKFTSFNQFDIIGNAQRSGNRECWRRISPAWRNNSTTRFHSPFIFVKGKREKIDTGANKLAHWVVCEWNMEFSNREGESFPFFVRVFWFPGIYVLRKLLFQERDVLAALLALMDDGKDGMKLFKRYCCSSLLNLKSFLGWQKCTQAVVYWLIGSVLTLLTAQIVKTTLQSRYSQPATVRLHQTALVL